MGDFKDYIKSKNGIRVLVILFLLIAIPLTIYLVRQQQIFKGKAAGEGSTFVITGSTGDFTPGNPPSTTSQFINLALNFGTGGIVAPTQAPVPTTPPPPTATTAPGQPTSTPVPSVLSLSASPLSVSTGGNVTVAWNGVNAVDDYWYIRDSQNLGNPIYLNSCSTTPPAGGGIAPTQPPSYSYPAPYSYPTPSTPSCAQNGQFCNGTTRCCSGLTCRGFSGSAGSSGTCGFN